MPPHDDDPPDEDDEPLDEDDEALDDDDDDVEEPDEPTEGDDPSAPPIDPALVRRYLSTPDALATARTVVRKLVPPDDVEELAGDALVRALRARPPHLEVVLPAWLMTIARRRAARWLEKRARRRKYEGPMPTHVAREDDYTGEVVDDGSGADPSYDPTADEEPVEMLGTYLARLIGDDPRDRETLAIIREHSDAKKPYRDIAAARGETEAQIANRILRFKAKYGARVKKRKQWMLVLKWAGGLAAVAVAAVVLWWLFHRGPGDIRRDPSEREAPPAPSATASTPVFQQALPPGPSTPDKPAPPPERKP